MKYTSIKKVQAHSTTPFFSVSFSWSLVLLICLYSTSTNEYTMITRTRTRTRMSRIEKQSTTLQCLTHLLHWSPSRFKQEKTTCVCVCACAIYSLRRQGSKKIIPRLELARHFEILAPKVVPHDQAGRIVGASQAVDGQQLFALAPETSTVRGKN